MTYKISCIPNIPMPFYLRMGFTKYTYIKGRVEESSLKLDHPIFVKLDLRVD